MNKIKLVLICVITCFLTSCAQKSALKNLDFLAGTWKIEGREVYESWTKQNEKFVGKAYRLVQHVEKISETLEIRISNNKVIYTATVLNQNEGKGIPFTLNINNEEWFSFENMKHDFPNKIQYKIISDKELQVNVVGRDGRGFSHKLIKQE